MVLTNGAHTLLQICFHLLNILNLPLMHISITNFIYTKLLYTYI